MILYKDIITNVYAVLLQCTAFASTSLDDCFTYAVSSVYRSIGLFSTTAVWNSSRGLVYISYFMESTTCTSTLAKTFVVDN